MYNGGVVQVQDGKAEKAIEHEIPRDLSSWAIDGRCPPAKEQDKGENDQSD